MSEDEEAQLEHPLPLKDLPLQHVIIKTINYYSIPTEISEAMLRTFKAKLWRMGNTLSKMGGYKRMETIESWKDKEWKLEIDVSEVKYDEIKRKFETKLEKEKEKRKKLEQEITTLKNANKKLTKQYVSGNPIGRGPSTRSWQSYGRQQQLNKKKKLANGIQTALQFCKQERFKACNVEIQNINTNKRVIINLDKKVYQPTPTLTDSDEDRLCAVTLVKDKFTISDAAYHELSMVSNLPNFYKVKKAIEMLNKEFDIKAAPNSITGVQQSLIARVEARLRKIITKMPDIKKSMLSLPEMEHR